MAKSLGEQNYETFAYRYAAAVETKPHNAYYERPATRSLLPDVKGQRVLDAGCGPGINTEWLVDHGAKVVAVDVTPDFVEITRRRVGDRAVVRCADLTQPLDFAGDQSFDGVLSALVLDYIEDWGAVFRQFARVLKPGGWLVFSCGHPVADWLYVNEANGEVTDYFETQRFEMVWKGFGEPHPVISSYRRPMSAVINPLLEVGLRLDYWLEPRPTEEYREADPQNYARMMRQPGFLCVRAIKT